MRISDGYAVSSIGQQMAALVPLKIFIILYILCIKSRQNNMKNLKRFWIILINKSVLE